MPIEAPFLNSKGELATPSVLAQIDARTKATMRADLPALADELKIGGVDEGVLQSVRTTAEAAKTTSDSASREAKTAHALAKSVADGAGMGPGGVTDGAVASVVLQPDTQTRATLDELTAARVRQMPFAPCRHLEDSGGAGPTTDAPIPLGSSGGYVYAAAGAVLLRATTPNGPWTTVKTFNASHGTLTTFRATGDGEVLLAQGEHGLWRSTGWSKDPTTATWTLTLASGGPIQPFTMTVDPVRGWVGVTTYITGTDMTNRSRYAWLSTDYGRTFRVIYDKMDHHKDVNPATSHMHTVAFDPYINDTRPRIWVVWHKTSDDPTMPTDPRNVMTYSDDAGATWKDHSTDILHPVLMIPTVHGMVHDTDHPDIGTSLMLLDRRTGVSSVIYRRRTTDTDVTNLWGWGSDWVAGTEPGVFHMLWRSTKGGAPAGVLTTDGVRTTETVTIPATSPVAVVDARSLFLHDGRLVGVTGQSAGGGTAWSWWSAREPQRGAPTTPLGGMEGGVAGDQGVAVGLDAGTSGLNPWKAVSVGEQATAQREGVAVGWRATLTGFASTAIGHLSSALTQAVAIGSRSVAGSLSAVVGYGATAASRSTAIGHSAAASANDGTAAGHLSRAGSMSVAAGVNAQAPGANVVAVGAGTATVSNSTAVGQGSKTMAAAGTAVGRGATAGQESTALGDGAAATGRGSIALGFGASVTSSAPRAVALSGSVASQEGEVSLGDRFVSLTEATRRPGTVPNGVALFVQGGELRVNIGGTISAVQLRPIT